MRAVNGYDVKSGRDYCFVDGETTEFAEGDEMYVGTETMEIDDYGVEEVVFTVVSGTSGSNCIVVQRDSDGAHDILKASILNSDSLSDGLLIEEGGTSEEIKPQRVVVGDNNVYLFLQDELINNFTAAATATVHGVVKLSFTTDWTINEKKAHICKDAWTSVDTANYETELDPYTNNVDGHIKLYDNSFIKSVTAFRVTYTPIDHAWLSGQSGYIYIAQSKGNNLAMVEGPNFKEEEGSDLLYIFKNNGDVHAIIGKPGEYGEGMDVRYISSGIYVRPRSIKVGREGVYFGYRQGIDYKIGFISHGDKLLTKDLVPILNEDNVFTDDGLPLDDESYTFYEAAAILEGDKYVICFPNDSTGDLPVTNGNMYICQIYRDKNERIKGRWAIMKEACIDEYEAGSTNVISDDGRANTLGFYEHNGMICRVYHIRTGYDYSGDTRYYEIAQYSWNEGGEECKQKYVYTYDDGASHTTEFSTDYFYATITYGMITWGEWLDLYKTFFDAEVSGGVTNDGIKLTMNIYRDLDYSTLMTGMPIIIEDLMDDESACKILTELNESNNMRMHFKYIQISLIFSNIKYNDKPAYVFFKNLGIEAAILADKGLLSNEKHTNA